MRYFLLIILLFFVRGLGYGQEKGCPFPYKLISKPDSTKTQQLIKAIAALDLKTYYEVDKIPGFILNTLKCWSPKWTIAEPGGNYNEGCTVEDSLPNRQLLYIGLHEQHTLIAYNIGGGWCSNTVVMLFRHENKKITSVKYWYCRNKYARTKEDISGSLQCLEFYIIAMI